MNLFTNHMRIFEVTLVGLLAALQPHSATAQALTAPPVRHNQPFDRLGTDTAPVSESVAPSRQSLPTSKEPTAGPGENNGTSEDTIAQPTSETDDIFDLDIDQLSQIDVVVPAFDVEVTSVIKSESTVGQSPAAIFVITPAMIRRSGAVNIPQLLRLVPGMQVARINANIWAISARGFNDRFANKLLVMIDGRSVYTPLFSGVYWDVQDLVLEDIDRIEVIRGPGSTVWGANAVNGVINIITKRAQETQGALIVSGGGTEERAHNAVRYGGSINGPDSSLYYRVYAKHFERDTGFNPMGANDDWRQGRFGFRTDFSLDSYDSDTFTLQGDYYTGEAGSHTHLPTLVPPFPTIMRIANNRVAGGNILGKWTHQFDDQSHFVFQMYYDRTERFASSLRQEIDILDLDFTHRFPLGDDNALTWGFRYRYVSDDLAFPADFFSLDPARRRTDLVSAFVQDELTLVDDILFLTFGSKFEHNDFTGFEFQPSARLLWSVDPRHAAWAAVSRAVRTPSRVDDDLRIQFAIAPVPPTFLSILGDRNVESEDLLAYEIGFRAQPTDKFSWDVAAFFNDYSDLIVSVNGTPILPPPSLILRQFKANAMDGQTYGVELTACYDITDAWRVSGAYSFLQVELSADANAARGSEDEEGQSPHNQAYLRSSWDLSRKIEFDAIGRYVDELPTFGVDHYFTLDLRLGYHPNADWKFSVVARNLLQEHQLEFQEPDVVGSEVDRGVYGQVVWRH